MSPDFRYCGLENGEGTAHESGGGEESGQPKDTCIFALEHVWFFINRKRGPSKKG